MLYPPEMPVDYHIHTRLCGHATGEMWEYVEEAVQKGFREVGFSDHFPFIERVAPRLAMSWEQLSLYIQEVDRLTSKYSKIITIRKGIEIDYEPHLEEQIREALQRYDFDYVYGSVHNIGDWQFDSPREQHRWEHCDVRKTYEEYFHLVQQAAASGLFDIIAHLDVVKKFGYRPSGDYFALIQETLDAIEKAGVAIELNTSGLRKPVGEIYPDLRTLEECIRRGIPVTFGSDAHRPQEVGQDIAHYAQKLKGLGLTEVAVFANRKRTLVEI